MTWPVRLGYCPPGTQIQCHPKGPLFRVLPSLGGPGQYDPAHWARIAPEQGPRTAIFRSRMSMVLVRAEPLELDVAAALARLVRARLLALAEYHARKAEMPMSTWLRALAPAAVAARRAFAEDVLATKKSSWNAIGKLLGRRVAPEQRQVRKNQ